MTETWMELVGSMLAACAAIWFGNRYAETGGTAWLAACLLSWLAWLALLAHACDRMPPPPSGRAP